MPRKAVKICSLKTIYETSFRANAKACLLFA